MADNVTLPAQGTGSTTPVVSTVDESGEQIQRMYAAHQSRSDTYTTTATGTTIDATRKSFKTFGLQVKATGSVTSWTVVLEGSLDGTNFVTILSHSNTDGDGAILWTGPNFRPCRHFRSRCTALTLGGGTNVVATIIGMP